MRHNHELVPSASAVQPSARLTRRWLENVPWLASCMTLVASAATGDARFGTPTRRGPGNANEAPFGASYYSLPGGSQWG